MEFFAVDLSTGKLCISWKKCWTYYQLHARNTECKVHRTKTSKYHKSIRTKTFSCNTNYGLSKLY